MIAWREPKRLIFLDETWFTTNMVRLYGYAPRGQRIIATIPHGHYKKLTFVGGLTVDGMIATKAFVGSMTAGTFIEYIEDVLLPATRPGDLLIMDNLPAHKTASVQETLRAFGIAYQYLPPYSPDLNPIEKSFSKLKRLARKAAERTIDGLQKQVGNWVGSLRPEECVNYFKNAGYAAT